MKINLPNNMSLDLTDDQVKELRKQLDKPEMPTTWREAFNALPKGKYYIGGGFSTIISGEFAAGDDSRNCVCSEKQAKSVLAYTQLLVIISALNGSAEMPSTDYFSIYYNENGFYGYAVNDRYTKHFRLKTAEAANHLVNCFSDLLNDFYMIDK